MLLGTAAFRRRAAAPLRSVAYLDLAGINAASVAMSVGAYAPGRALFALAFQSNTLASLTIDGITPSLLASGNAGGMNVYLWATSASTGERRCHRRPRRLAGELAGDPVRRLRLRRRRGERL